MMTRPQVHAFRIETMRRIETGEFTSLADYTNARAWTFAAAVLLADMGVNGFIADHREQYIAATDAWSVETLAARVAQ